MAIPTALNGQITDSVTQAGLSVLASAPAVAMGTLYQSMAHSMGILYQNSAMAQQQAAISSQAANLGVIQMYSVNTMAGATAAARLGRNDNTDLLLALLVVLAVAKKK